MAPSKQISSTHLDHVPAFEPDAAVNDAEMQEERNNKLTHLLDEACLPGDTGITVRNLMDQDPREKQQAGEMIRLFLTIPRQHWEKLRMIWKRFRTGFEELVQVAELLLTLSPDKKGSFLDLLCEESKKESTLNGSKPKAIGFHLKHGPIEGTEAVNPNNKRYAFTAEEMKDGYLRANVKIDSVFPDGSSVSGSGTLIGERVVVMTAHSFYDPEEDPRPAESITVRTGVHGRSGSVEIRHGIYAVLSFTWYTDRVRTQDFGLILLDSRFETAIPMQTRQTPHSEMAEVYGFSSDKPYNGLMLCQAVSMIKYDHDKTAGMVEHVSSTYYGASGGAVVGKDGRLIAVHKGFVSVDSIRKGFDTVDGKVINHAVAIDREGNNIAAFIAVLYGMAKHDCDNGHGLGYVDVTVNEGTSVKVEMIRKVKEANGFEGLVFTW